MLMIERFKTFHPLLTSLQFNVNNYLALLVTFMKGMHSSLEANTVNMLVCLCSWLSVDIWAGGNAYAIYCVNWIL